MKANIAYGLIIISLSLLSSCIIPYDFNFFRFENYTEEEISVVMGYLDETEDTTIIIDDRSEGLSSSMEFFRDLKPMEIRTNSVVITKGDNYDDNYIKNEYHGLMRVFVVKTEDVKALGWKEVAEKNMVLQRYDITDQDLEKINRQLSFPPTPAMVNISMWPPYGTYPTRLTK